MYYPSDLLSLETAEEEVKRKQASNVSANPSALYRERETEGDRERDKGQTSRIALHSTAWRGDDAKGAVKLIQRTKGNASI